MRVAIVSTQVPFVRGGAELLAEACKEQMEKRKIKVELISIPYKGYPAEIIYDHMKTARLIDLSEFEGLKIDKVICLKFPTYYCYHKNKSLWLLHQHRAAYDLYGTAFSDLHLSQTGKRIAKTIVDSDNQWIPEHQQIFTISKKVAKRLLHYNGIPTNAVLYPPPKDIEKFHCHSYENFVLYSSRFTELKRQELIVRAMQWAPSKLKLLLIGDHHTVYGTYIKRLINTLNLSEKVFLTEYINERDKIELYSRCLAVYNGVYDEDYGYVTIEAFLSSKPVITHFDSGGPLEFVVNNQNGFVLEPCETQIADALMILYKDKKKTKELGYNGFHSLQSKNICWDHVINHLLT